MNAVRNFSAIFPLLSPWYWLSLYAYRDYFLTIGTAVALFAILWNPDCWNTKLVRHTSDLTTVATHKFSIQKVPGSILTPRTSILADGENENGFQYIEKRVSCRGG
jgi:hypothetical protein